MKDDKTSSLTYEVKIIVDFKRTCHKREVW